MKDDGYASDSIFQIDLAAHILNNEAMNRFEVVSSKYWS